MDDDGLVLNLTFDEPATSKRIGSIKKTGKWTDRLKAKRVAERKRKIPEQKSGKARAQEPLHHALDDDADLPEDSPRPQKRLRLDMASAKTSTHTSAASTKPPPITGHFVSSLFTSNPTIKPPASVAVPTPIGAPSNAPVTDSSTFTGLGLDPLLAVHLETKMSIQKPTSIQRSTFPLLLSGEQTRDVFIQSQTGSGKTLSFLLPIIQDLLPLSKESYIDRSIGTLAIIIAPTRELAKQISDVLDSLLSLRLRPENDEDGEGTRLTRWMISGVLTGGATRTHEKARLRKGLPILVSTPGRLLDHLQNTASFNVGKCRWLVLDEADRLMDLGFEETITGILKGLDGRRNLAVQAAREGTNLDVGGWDWSRRRRTVLCSATIREDVQKLAGQTLLDPIVVKGATDDVLPTLAQAAASAADTDAKFVPPAQLQQKCIVVPLKLRLVTLVALLRSLISKATSRNKGSSTKIIVFMSCTDSVDFHWDILCKANMGGDDDAGSISASEDDEDEDEEKGNPEFPARPAKRNPVEGSSALLPDTSVFRLHGSLDTNTRLTSLKLFSHSTQSPASVLLCTSVAARGLDLPNVRAVVQYDLPTEGGATEHVHRIGRTARLGAKGEAWAFVAPGAEEGWIEWVHEKTSASMGRVGVDAILRGGLGGTSGRDHEDRATQVQTAFERWVLKKPEYADLARRAFSSHVRAYATHPSDEKQMFHVRHLHLGHLAKAFALREAPSNIKGVPNTAGNSKDRRDKSGKQRTSGKNGGTTEERMQDVVRKQGKLTRKGGVTMSSGADEFQSISVADLEKLAGAFARR
ncbi:DEAD-domain-containing protein [Auriculariales sp. MPI-PUGE-AT-0066]|nr:DEAD-domain-containing protein [Auriculariales sp. MPI-PUGE-AT-0066]